MTAGGRPVCPVTEAPLDLTDAALHGSGDPHAIWTQMREHDPVPWQQTPSGVGFWSATKHKDAAYVLRHPQAFTSERGTLLDLLGTDDPAGGKQIAATDPPRHTAMREPLQRALSMPQIEQRRDVIRNHVLDLLAPLRDGGVFDFAAAMFMLPMAVAGALMDLPREDWSYLTRLTTTCIAPDDPDYQHERGREYTVQRAHRELFAYFQDMVNERDAASGDDLISVLLKTEFEGRTMSTDEVVSNCYSLILGANVTTPHAPSAAVLELIGTPMLERWARDRSLMATGVEEALRWASPATHFLRYATADVELSGVQIASGDAVVVWLASANRDEEVFDDPFVFDVARRPNRHLAFGIGPHYCVGHTIARVSLRLLFEELLATFTDFELAGDPQRLHSNFVSGTKHLPITARLRSERAPTVVIS